MFLVIDVFNMFMNLRHGFGIGLTSSSAMNYKIVTNIMCCISRMVLGLLFVYENKVMTSVFFLCMMLR